MAKDDKPPKEPYGDVPYADPGYQKDGKKRYPIDTEEHIRAAWNYINHPDNSGLYEAGNLKSIKSRIVAAWKDVIDKAGPPSSKSNSVPPLVSDDNSMVFATRIRAADKRDYKAATAGVTFRVGKMSPEGFDSYYGGYPGGTNLDNLARPAVDTNQMSIFSIKFDSDKFGFGDVLDWTKENNYWIGRFAVSDDGIELFVGPPLDWFDQSTLVDIPATASVKRNCADGTARNHADAAFKSCGDCSNKNRCAKMGDCFLDEADNHQLAQMLIALMSRARRARDHAGTPPSDEKKKKKPDGSDDEEPDDANMAQVIAATDLLSFVSAVDALDAAQTKTKTYFEAANDAHVVKAILALPAVSFRDAKSKAHDIKGVEIFKAGKWNGDEYTIKDLDAMVAAFQNVGYQPPIKLGHDGTDGDRAWGWVSNIYRKGDTLYADFADVPDELHKVIADHGYDHVSAEIYWDLERNGKKFSRALKAVALLGAATPAVSDLAPLRTCLSIDAGADAKVKTYTFAAKETKMTKKTIAELTADVRDLRAKLHTATADVRTLAAKIAAGDKTLDDRAAAAKAKIEEIQTQIDEAEAARDAAYAANETALASVQTQMSGLLEQNARMLDQQRMDRVAKAAAACRLPALRQHFLGLYDVLSQSPDRKYTLKVMGKDDKEVTSELTGTQLVDDIVAHINKTMAKVESTHAQRGSQPQDGNGEDDATDGDEIGRPDLEVTTKAKEMMAKDTTLTFPKATVAVLAADADLRQRYAKFTTPGGVS